jgi:hypothetical protein
LAAAKPMHGILPMLRAINNLSRDKISSFHCEFTKLCLKANCFQHSLPVITQTHIDVLDGCSAIEICTYNYYSGLLFIGLRQFQQAIVSLNQCLT